LLVNTLFKNTGPAVETILIATGGMPRSAHQLSQQDGRRTNRTKRDATASPTHSMTAFTTLQGILRLTNTATRDKLPAKS